MQIEEALLGLLISKQSESFQRHIRKYLSNNLPSSLLSEDNEPGEKIRDLIQGNVVLDKAISDIERWRAQGIATLSGFSLKTALPICDPPFVLFIKGNTFPNFLEIPCLSIVGTRKCDQFGIDIATTLSELVASNGNTIVSGIAAGIDGAAHEGALKTDNKFPTVAVLGNGVNVVYPAIHKRLSARILDSGGILMSEYEPDERPLPYRFLERNRIIASLSHGLVVIQASAKSGSLATARFALEMGRDVVVVPGNFQDARYEGSHRLIQHGAYLLSSFSEVFDLIPVLNKTSETTNIPSIDITLTESQRSLALKLKEKGTLHMEELRAEVGNHENFAEDLLYLELEDIIYHEPGDFLSLRSFVIP